MEEDEEEAEQEEAAAEAEAEATEIQLRPKAKVLGKLLFSTFCFHTLLHTKRQRNTEAMYRLRCVFVNKYECKRRE